MVGKGLRLGFLSVIGLITISEHKSANGRVVHKDL